MTAPSGTTTKSAKAQAKNQATELTELAHAEYTFFHDQQQTPWVIVQDECGVRTVMAIRTTEFRSELASRYHALYGSTPGTRGIDDAIRVLTRTAVKDSPENRVYIRVAPFGDEAIIIDLGNPARECVFVDGSGWRIQPQAPVLFRRPQDYAALPTPEPGGKLADIRQVVNVAPADLGFLLAWLSFAFDPEGPYPILQIRAEQGSGKSGATRFLKALVDPAHTPPRAEPRDTRDLMISTKSNWVLAYDNLSNIPDWLSDSFCRISTGGGFGTRRLYEDDEEKIFSAKRPLLVNGIVDVTARGDFISRSLLVDLPAITDAGRKDEHEINALFEKLYPRLFGALLGLVSQALQRRRQVRLERLPRMADFARWGVAIEGQLGFGPGEFLERLLEKQHEGNTSAADASLVSYYLMDFIARRPLGWTGTAGQLLTELHEFINKPALAQALPKNPNWMGNELRRIAPGLREKGYGVEFKRKTAGIEIKIYKFHP